MVLCKHLLQTPDLPALSPKGLIHSATALEYNENVECEFTLAPIVMAYSEHLPRTGIRFEFRFEVNAR